MRMKLYVIKTDQGYFKKCDSGEYTCVPLEKASVFNNITPEQVQKFFDIAKKMSLTNICLAELHITERVIQLAINNKI